MRETPGIGDKIITDRNSSPTSGARRQTQGRPLGPGQRGQGRQARHQENAWQIDAISGATITSRAVGKAINDSAQALLPRLVPNLDKLGSKS
jgi:electron transport complex protein RnfG